MTMNMVVQGYLSELTRRVEEFTRKYNADKTAAEEKKAAEIKKAANGKAGDDTEPASPVEAAEQAQAEPAKPATVVRPVANMVGPRAPSKVAARPAAVDAAL